MTAAVLLIASLTLPAPGTTSRERGFCRAWLELSAPEKHALLKQQTTQPACGHTHRERLRRLLDYECRNWRLLMHFEVRDLVDRVERTCPPGP